MAARPSSQKTRTARSRKASAAPAETKPRRAPAAGRKPHPLSPSLQRVVERLRTVIRRAAPQATEVVKWGLPVYSQNGLVCYIKTSPTHVTVGFFDEARSPVGPDDAAGRETAMRHVKLRSESDIGPELTAWIRQAVARNTGSR